MGETIRTLGALPPDPVRPDVREKLLDRFRTWKPGDRR
jgi:hypothetical protein